MELSKEARALKLGIYEHFKEDHHRYEVLGVARYSETLEEMVVYRALYGEEGLWVRPLSLFLKEAEKDGVAVPRFKYVRDKQDSKNHD